ncbi:hypothetical protein ACOWPH_28190 [Anabaena sp. PCC 7938]|nr:MULTISPECIES: hypothetical protein [Anabaena]
MNAIASGGRSAIALKTPKYNDRDHWGEALQRFKELEFTINLKQ